MNTGTSLFLFYFIEPELRDQAGQYLYMKAHTLHFGDKHPASPHIDIDWGNVLIFVICIHDRNG